MTDMEKQYAYELQRRQAIGNYLNRMGNLGYGNAVGVGLVKSTDEEDVEMENEAKSLEPQENGGKGLTSAPTMESEDKTEEIQEEDSLPPSEESKDDLFYGFPE